MSGKRASPHRIKANRTYSVNELAERLGVHKATIRNWYRSGLDPIDGGKPLLFHGSRIKAFLAGRALDARQKCADGEFYCLSCRAPRRPADGIVSWRKTDGGTATVSALCDQCETPMHRFVARLDIERIRDVHEANEKRLANAYANPADTPSFGTSLRTQRHASHQR